MCIRDSSYVEPYIDTTGGVRAYGAVDLQVLGRYDWRLARGNVWRVSQLLYDIPHRPIRCSAARMDRLRARYFTFRREHPGRKPVFYDRSTWSVWPRSATRY